MEKAFLVGVNLDNGEDFQRSLEELGSLAEACDMEVVGMATQNLEQINKGLYIGPGKAEEVAAAAQMQEADIIIFDNSLTPSQLRNLQEVLKRPVMDRSALILDIFASRAKSREAKLQVELARLQYLLPRLIGMHDALSRQGGASGAMSNKGAGEKKLELDRRRLENRITELRKELAVVVEERKTQRKRRASSGIPRVALVGYTNAGKSTLMNALLNAYATDEVDTEEKKVFEKDMLFATLDTTVRKIAPENHHAFLLSDTVGFIDKLPHNLVEAFQSTLEEAKEADVLLQVVDYSDPHYKEQIQVTNKTLKQLGAESIPMILVYNKADIVAGNVKNEKPGQNIVDFDSYKALTAVTDTEKEFLKNLPVIRRENETDYRIYMSAKQGAGLEELISLIEECMAGGYKVCRLLIPFTDGRALSYLNEHAVIISTEYLPEGTLIEVNCKLADVAYYEKYMVTE